MSVRLTSSAWAWDFATPSSRATAVAPHSGRSALNRSSTRPARLTVWSIEPPPCGRADARRPTARTASWERLTSWRRSRARPRDEPGRDRHGRRALARGELLQQQADAPAAHLVEVLVDGRQRRREVGGLRDVVEPDDAHGAGNGAAALV